ncbi:hypothetical protein [Streptomyces varsoviensis]|uniref:hypothetical protein n=1 Tax=Streptomyces varsoviensis TaxID=67373 RepID=UPI00068A0283|nr:hypothetical protein [Streptomyces varsoviensis]
MHIHRRGRATPLRPPRQALAAGSLALIALALTLPFAAGGGPRRFLDYTGGVLTLLCLTATVVWGLIASGRALLSPRGRLLAQAVHRATAVCALGFLLLHVALKVADAHVGPLAALLPFSLGVRGAGGLIGLGSLAGHLMVLAAATGTLRSVFAGRGRAAGRWRALHACAYPAWCAAILHGLKSGRPPAAWVSVCYGLCLAAVAGALVLRLVRARRARRREADAARPARTPRTAPHASAPARRRADGTPLLPRPRPAPDPRSEPGPRSGAVPRSEAGPFPAARGHPARDPATGEGS